MTDSDRQLSRRAVLRTGTGLAAGAATVAGTVAGTQGRVLAGPPSLARQSGTPLCDNRDDSAWRQGLGSGDLCIPYHRAHDNSWGYVFGDSWTDLQQYGEWMSPAMLCQQSFDASGNTPIEFTWALPSGGNARQLFDYQHNANNGLGDTEVTRIPNDCIEFGGRTYIQYTSVFTWEPPAGWDGSVASGVAYSDDYGVTWRDYDYHWPGDRTGGNQSLYGMWSFVGIVDGWLYIYSKRWNGTHRNTEDFGELQLFRIRPDQFRAGNFGAQENWAYVGGSWQWTSSATPPTPMLRGNHIGEFSVKRIGNTYCMSYFDVTDYSIRTRTASAPDAQWSAPKTQIVGDGSWPPEHWGKPVRPSLYGGYIHPGSASATSLTLIVSQWDGTVHSPPYWVLQYDGINP